MKGLISTLNDCKVPTSPEGDEQIEVEIPDALASIAKYVKGENETVPLAGRVAPKAAAAAVINFLPYSQRSFLIYIADLASALQLLTNVHSEKKSLAYPFGKQVCFLDLVHAVKDCHRCPSAEVNVAAQKLVLLCSNDMDEEVMS